MGVHRGPAPSLTGEELYDSIEDILLYLEEGRDSLRRYPAKMVDMRTFHNLHPFTSEYQFGAVGPEEFHVSPYELPRRLDVSLLADRVGLAEGVNESQTLVEGSKFLAVNYREVGKRALIKAGLDPRQVTNKIVEVTQLIVSDEGQAIPWIELLLYNKLSGWQYTSTMLKVPPITAADLIAGAKFAYTLQAWDECNWRVSVGLDSGPTVAFLTDPTGAREVFKLRDAPPGKKRRAALRNWVKQHWRKSRKNPEVEHSVRKHLRGTTDFVWNGLTCEVRPSLYDGYLNLPKANAKKRGKTRRRRKRR